MKRRVMFNSIAVASICRPQVASGYSMMDLPCNSFFSLNGRLPTLPINCVVDIYREGHDGEDWVALKSTIFDPESEMHEGELSGGFKFRDNLDFLSFAFHTQYTTRAYGKHKMLIELFVPKDDGNPEIDGYEWVVVDSHIFRFAVYSSPSAFTSGKYYDLAVNRS